MFQFDKRILYIMIGLFVFSGLTRYLSNTTELISLLLTIPAVLIAITFHEFAHAFAADRLGDDTPRRQGRLTLNPISHLDPIGSIMLIFAGFGWGKPVQINPRNFTSRMSASASEAVVSIAGPLMNFFLAIVFSIIYCALIRFGYTFCLTQLGMIILTLVQITVIINVGLGVFNLIPLPPLDGSKVLRNFLPYSAKEWMDRNSHIIYIVFLGLWITGLASLIISPIISGVYSGITYLIGMLFALI